MNDSNLMKAENFCKKTGTEVAFKYLGEEAVNRDTQRLLQNTYSVTVARKSYSFSFKYYTEKGIEPDVYSALCCLSSNTWEVRDFDDFVRAFCYDENKIDIYDYEIYQKVYKNVMKMFGDVLNELLEIS